MIVYQNKVGKDFNGILRIFDDVNNKNECIPKSLEMIPDGYKNVDPFKFCENRRKNIEDIYEWKYVKDHSIMI